MLFYEYRTIHKKKTNENQIIRLETHFYETFFDAIKVIKVLQDEDNTASPSYRKFP